jgi:hypothetical protein
LAKAFTARMPPMFSSDASELRPPVALHRGAVARADADADRHHRRRDEGQRPVHEEHQDEGAGQRHHRDEEVLGSVMRHLADLLEILGDARHEVAGLLPVVEAERQLLQVVEGLPAHLRLDLDAEHVAPVGHHHVEPGGGGVDHQQADHGEPDQPPIVARQQRVDEGLHRHREAELEQPGDHGAAEVEQEEPAMRAIIGEEGFEHGWGLQGPGCRGQRGRCCFRSLAEVL